MIRVVGPRDMPRDCSRGRERGGSQIARKSVTVEFSTNRRRSGKARTGQGRGDAEKAQHDGYKWGSTWQAQGNISRTGRLFVRLPPRFAIRNFLPRFAAVLNIFLSRGSNILHFSWV